MRDADFPGPGAWACVRRSSLSCLARMTRFYCAAWPAGGDSENSAWGVEHGCRGFPVALTNGQRETLVEEWRSPVIELFTGLA